MREIKFRAWIKVSQKIASWEMIEERKNLHRLIKDTEYSLMQYTGLKDKNGVEIYEGDIVKWGHLPNRSECWHRVAYVELFPCLQFHILHYIDGKTLEKKKGDNYIFGYSNFIYKDTHNSLEVIGNIYENKELLQ